MASWEEEGSAGHICPSAQPPKANIYSGCSAWGPAQPAPTTGLDVEALSHAEAHGTANEASSTTKPSKANEKCSLLIPNTWQIKLYLLSFKNIFLSYLIRTGAMPLFLYRLGQLRGASHVFPWTRPQSLGMPPPWHVDGKERLIDTEVSPGTGLQAHTCNPSYSGARDQEDHSWKPARENGSRDPISKNPITKRAGGVT
jgi:hypothetical protein